MKEKLLDFCEKALGAFTTLVGFALAVYIGLLGAGLMIHLNNYALSAFK